MEKTLDQLKPGDAAVIRRFSEDNTEIASLMEMGLLSGTAVELIKLAPLGDPMEIRFRGYHLSIRKSTASNILLD